MQLLRNLPGSLRQARARRTGVAIAAGCRIAPQVVVELGLAAGRKGVVSLGERCELARGSLLRAWGGSITLGSYVFVGEYTVIYGHGGVTIGDDTLIAMHCRIVSSNHTVPGRGGQIRHFPDILKPTVIGRDVWLGAGVTVLGGVTVGDGCVVGAGAVVSKSLPPYSIAVGVPAAVVGYRE